MNENKNKNEIRERNGGAFTFSNWRRASQLRMLRQTADDAPSTSSAPVGDPERLLRRRPPALQPSAPAPVSPVRSVPWSPGSPSSVSCACFGTIFLFDVPLGIARAPFRFSAAASNNGSCGTLSPAPASGTLCMFVCPVCEARWHLKINIILIVYHLKYACIKNVLLQKMHLFFIYINDLWCVSFIFSCIPNLVSWIQHIFQMYYLNAVNLSSFQTSVINGISNAYVSTF